MGNRHFIFDLDDTPAVQRGQRSVEGEASDAADVFWERYTREELQYAPRCQTYRPLGSQQQFEPADLLLQEIENMLTAAPGERNLHLVRGAVTPTVDTPGTSSRRSLTARQQLRARNLLRRWARPLPDPRHAWLSPDAPARNYEALVGVLALAWLGEALEPARMIELLGETWTGLLGSASRRGLVDRAEPELRDAVVRGVNADVRDLAGGMAYSALTLPGWTAFIYDWQPFLARGVDLELLGTGDLACAVVEAITGETINGVQVAKHLSDRAAYIDEEIWGDRLATKLGLGTVRLVRNAGIP